VGADQLSDAPVINRPLTAKDVGPDAPEEQGRPLLSAPKGVEWIAAGGSR
jgi:hypothetical protein